MDDKRLAPHFKLSEFLHSDYAIERGVDNTPTSDILVKISWVAGMMEIVRGILGEPISITSGYRNLTVNKGIGGSATSAHMTGLAVDFQSPKFGTPAEIVHALLPYQDELKWDQLIDEIGWVHIGWAKRPRGEVLVALAGGGFKSFT